MRHLTDILFPRRCLGCGELLLPDERDASVCDPCAATVHRVQSPRCPRCSTPREVRSGVDAICSSCLTDPPAWDRVDACWVYDGAVSDAIRRAKASGDPSTLAGLAELSAEWFAARAAEWGGARWLTPPPHPVTLRRRGWEPAATLARLLTSRTRRSMTWTRSLRKVRLATKQALLDRETRRAALRGAFEPVERLQGPYVVFDDVMTTGATMNAVARALRRGGADRVIGIVIARSL